MHDLKIVNAKVFNSDSCSFEEHPVCITDGVIAGFDDEKSRQVIDARGCVLSPGLIDEHLHIDYQGSLIGANADTLCVPSGITSVCDGGTCGVSSFTSFYNNNILRYETHTYSYLNAQTFGNKSVCLHEEDQDPKDFREDLIAKCFERYGDVLRGLKIRLCRGTLGDSGVGPETLKAGLKIRKKLQEKGNHCPLVVHYGDLPADFPIATLFDSLQKGDIVAHVMQTHGEQIFDDSGKVRDCVRKARERGVLMDDCHGRVHWSFENLERAISNDFLPDFISSDNIRLSEYVAPGFSLLYAMAVQSAAGMSVEQILRRVTRNPALALGIEDRAGEIKLGSCADLTVLKIEDLNDSLADNYGGQRKGNKLFIPCLTMISGRVAYRQIFF